MARRLFAASAPLDTGAGLGAVVRSLEGRVTTWYSDAPGTVLADISLTEGGAAIAGSTVTVGDGSVLPDVYGPPAGTARLYVRIAGSTFVSTVDAVPEGGGGGAVDSVDGLTGAVVLTTDAAAGTGSKRTLGTTATSAAAGNDARLSDARTPTSHASTHNSGGADALAANAAAGTPSLRSLGSTSTTAAAGNDSRLSDARTPTSHATSHNSGGADALTADAAAGTASLRTLGTTATTATAGNDPRLSDARTPTAHKTSHEPGGSDALTVDAAVGVGSLRTLGTGAAQALPGNHATTTDARTPLAHAASHNSGGADALAADAAAGTPSLRSLGTTATTAAAGNDARLSDARTPTAHKATHEPGGSDAMAVDQDAGIASLRTLGTGAAQALPGNHESTTDARTPTAHATAHAIGGTDPLVEATVNRERFYTRPSGVLAETCDRAAVTGNLNPLATGRLFLVRVILDEGMTISTVGWVSGSTGATTPLNQWACLYDKNRGKLRVSDDKTTDAWAANTLKTFTLDSAYEVPTTDLYYVGLCVVATIVPSICGVSGASTTGAHALAPIIEGASTSSLTNPASAPATAQALGPLATMPYAQLGA